MAQLKDLIVNGATRLIGKVIINETQVKIIDAPSTSGSTTYGPGTNGQVLKSNGSSVYWGNDNNSGTVTSVNISASGALSASGGPITTSGTITISHSTAAGYKHIPSGGSSGQFLGWDSSGTAKWVSSPVSVTSVQTKTGAVTLSNSSSSVTISPSTTDIYSMTSAGSVTAGTPNTPTTPAVIDTSKFSGGSFTQGSFSGGSFSQGSFSSGSLSMSINSTDSKQLDIVFQAPSHGNDSFTPATHASDSHSAATINSGFYTAGTKGTANVPTSVTLPSRSSVIKAWTGYSSATAAAQTITGSN